MKPLSSFVICAGFGAATGLFAFAPFHITWLLPVSLTVLMCVTLNSQLSYKSSLACALFFALGYYGCGLSWLGHSINMYGGASLAVTILLVTLSALWLSIYIIIPLLIVLWIYPLDKERKPTNLWLLYGLYALLLATMDGLKSAHPFGLAWLNYGVTATDSFLVGWLGVIGTFGTSFLVTLCAASIAVTFTSLRLFWKTHPKGSMRTYTAFSITCAIGLNAALWLSSEYLQKVSWTKKTDSSMTILLIQPNLSIETMWSSTGLKDSYDRLINLTQQGLAEGPVDLVLWPESAIPLAVAIEEESQVLTTLQQQVNTWETPLLTGLLTYQGDEVFNSTALLHPHHSKDKPNGSEDIQLYNKYHLVPFGEYLPLQAIFTYLAQLFSFPYSAITPGSVNQDLLSLSSQDTTLKLASYICYESAVPLWFHRRNQAADFTIIHSNTAWFGTTAGPAQHRQTVRARAIETKKWTTHVSSSGYSGVFNEHGVSIASIPANQPGYTLAKIYNMDGTTPAQYLTGLILWLLTGLSLVTVVLAKSREIARNKQDADLLIETPS